MPVHASENVTQGSGAERCVCIDGFVLSCVHCLCTTKENKLVLNLNPYQTPEIETHSFKTLFVDGPVQFSVVASAEMMADVHWACRRRWYFLPRFTAAVAGLFLVWIAGNMVFSTAVARSSVGVALLLMLLGLGAVSWAFYVRSIVTFLNRRFNEHRARAFGPMVFTLEEKFFTIETSLGSARVPWASVKRWRRTELVMTLDAGKYTLDISTVPFLPLGAMPEFVRATFQELFQCSWLSYAALYCAHAIRMVAAGLLLLGAYLQFFLGEDELFRWPIYKYSLIALSLACVVIWSCREAKVADFIRYWSWGFACLIPVGCVILQMIYFR